MKPQELRIGNSVSCFNDRVKVTQILPLWIESDYSPYGYIEYDKLEPIPLTEEWLLRFGFSIGNKELSNCDLWDKHWIGEFEIQKTASGWSFDPYGFDKGVWLQYVHQLQNLYFALTGKELEYNAI